MAATNILASWTSASAQWLRGRLLAAKAVLFSSFLWPLRMAFNWLTTILIAMLVIFITAYFLVWLLKSIACQFPGVDWLLWLSGNSCGSDTSSSSTGLIGYFHSAVQKVCSAPWISAVLQYHGIKHYGNLNSLDLKISSPSVQSTLSSRLGPAEVVLRSTYELQRIQEPAMDFDALTDQLADLQLAVFTAGSKIVQTSHTNRTAVAEHHY